MCKPSKPGSSRTCLQFICFSRCLFFFRSPSPIYFLNKHTADKSHITDSLALFEDVYIISFVNVSSVYITVLSTGSDVLSRQVLLDVSQRLRKFDTAFYASTATSRLNQSNFIALAYGSHGHGITQSSSSRVHDNHARYHGNLAPS